MDVYLFQAALLCESCGEKTRRTLTLQDRAPADPDDEHTYDSDEFPKGPYPDGGGEADSPQHCNYCEVFLENPLTDVGRDYVYEALSDPINARDDVLALWSEFYGIRLEPVRYADEPPERDFWEGDSPDY